MDPIIGGSLISAGSSLLGGIFGGNDGPSPGDTQRHTVAGIMGQAQGAREASAAYGFNPVSLLGVSSAVYPSASGQGNVMGQAIANAGLAVADGLTEASAYKAYVGKLEEQNKELRKALDGQTLRPKVPGIFGAPAPQAGVSETVTVPAISVQDGKRANVLEVGPGNLPTVVRGGNDDRPEEIKAVQNEPFYKKLDVFGRDLFVWNDDAMDNEILSSLSALTLPIQYTAGMIYDAGRFRAEISRRAGKPSHFSDRFSSQPNGRKPARPPQPKAPPAGAAPGGKWVWENAGRGGVQRWVYQQ